MLIRERACPGKTHNATPGSKQKKLSFQEQAKGSLQMYSSTENQNLTRKFLGLSE